MTSPPPPENEEAIESQLRIYTRSEKLPLQIITKDNDENIDTAINRQADKEGQKDIGRQIKAEKGKVIFRTSPSGADISINGRSTGKSPLLQPLSDGSYKVRIKKARYKPVSFYLDIQNDNIAAVHAVLKPYTGRIDPILTPEDTAVRVGDISVQEFPLEVPVGTYTIKAHKFGYEEKTLTTTVERGEIVRPEILLTPVPFKLDEISVSPRRGLSMPPLPLPKVRIKGSLSAPGRVQIDIIDNTQTLYSSKSLQLSDGPQFEHTVQLPPGSYRIRVTALADSGEDRIKTTNEYSIRVEETKPLYLLTSDMPATFAPLGIPRAQNLPAGVFKSALSLSAGGSAQSVPSVVPAHFQLSAGLPFSTEMGGSLSLLVENHQNSALSGSAYINTALGTIGKTVQCTASWQAYWTYLSDSISSAAAWFIPYGTGIGSGPVFELAVYPQEATCFGVTAAPALEWRPEDKNEHISWVGSFRSGAFFQQNRWAAGIGAATGSDFELFHYGLELSRMFPATSMHMNLYVGTISKNGLPDDYTTGMAFYYIR